MSQRLSRVDGDSPRGVSSPDIVEREAIVAKGMRMAVVLGLGILMALGVQYASAHKKVHASDVTLDFSDGLGGSAFHGHVTSPRLRCTRNRRVDVYRRLDGPDELIGKDVTGTDPEAEDNEYIVFPNEFPEDGTYVAIAQRKVLRKTDRHRHICGRAVSDPLTHID